MNLLHDFLTTCGIGKATICSTMQVHRWITSTFGPKSVVMANHDPGHGETHKLNHHCALEIRPAMQTNPLLRNDIHDFHHLFMHLKHWGQCACGMRWITLSISSCQLTLLWYDLYTCHRFHKICGTGTATTCEETSMGSAMVCGTSTIGSADST